MDCAILGTGCGATAGTGVLFNIAVAGTGGSGTGSIALSNIKLRNCANAEIPSAAGTPGTLTIASLPA